MIKDIVRRLGYQVGCLLGHGRLIAAMVSQELSKVLSWFAAVFVGCRALPLLWHADPLAAFVLTAIILSWAADRLRPAGETA